MASILFVFISMSPDSHKTGPTLDCLKLNIHIKDFEIGSGFKASCRINHLLYNIKIFFLYIKILSYLGQKGFLCSDFLLNTITTVQLGGFKFLF